MRQLHRLLGDFCHDFRNRLNTMQLALYLAGQGEQPVAPERLAPLMESYRGLLDLIGRLQLVCRPIRLEPVEVPLGLLIEERLAAWEAGAEARGVRFESEGAGASAAGVLDPTRLAQAFDELAEWRLKAAPRGTRIHLRWGLNSGRFRVEWAEEQPEPSGSGDTLRDGQGVLPLAILARILGEHGGEMKVSSPSPLRLALEWPSFPMPADRQSEDRSVGPIASRP